MAAGVAIGHRSVRCAAALLLACSAASASAVEVLVGASTPIEHEWTPVGAIAWQPELRTYARGVLNWDLGLTWVGARDTSRRRLDRSVLVSHLGFRFDRNDGLTLGFGIGSQRNLTDALSGEPQFVSTIGWIRGRWVFLVRHISNGGLDDPNIGETMLLAGMRF